MTARQKPLLSTIAVAAALLLASCTNSKDADEGFVYAKDGRLYLPNGEELALWGVNLQPCLSWEYNSLFKLIDIPLEAGVLKQATDNALDEIEKMRCDVIRAHLVPSDFTDSEGNLVETIYLDLLDYMVAEAAERGMYVYLTFLNPHMSYDIDVEDPSQHSPSVVPDTFLNDFAKRDLTFDPDFIAKSKNYITQLLNRKNPYTGRAYKNTTEVALWEIANEPLYYSFAELKETRHFAAFSQWADEAGLAPSQDTYYIYRHDRVLDYINTMYETIRAAGAVQPIVWNCNWHRMITGRRDVFDAIAKSKVEVVSFCNYPGQSILKKPYTKNPEDLSGVDFAGFLRDSYTKEDWYDWALTPEFMKKAKVVYEFETFYNYSGYLYPAQAEFFRAMGVQSATMWHYSMPAYAPYRNGSHHLSLTSTPKKAMAYAIAGEVFRATPLYQEFDIESPTERLTDYHMISFEKDLSIYSSDTLYMNSAAVSDGQAPAPSPTIQNIVGFERSPIVEYDGQGIYNIAISETEIHITIQPDAIHLKPQWGKDFLAGLVTRLETDASHSFELKLPEWKTDETKLYRIEGGEEIPQPFTGDGLAFLAQPGEYLIRQ